MKTKILCSIAFVTLVLLSACTANPGSDENANQQVSPEDLAKSIIAALSKSDTLALKKMLLSRQDDSLTIQNSGMDEEYKRSYFSMLGSEAAMRDYNTEKNFRKLETDLLIADAAFSDLKYIDCKYDTKTEHELSWLNLYINAAIKKENMTIVVPRIRKVNNTWKFTGNYEFSLFGNYYDGKFETETARAIKKAHEKEILDSLVNELRSKMEKEVEK